MRVQLKSLIVVGCLTLACSQAFANEVSLTVNQPMKVSYRIAHKNANSEIVYDSIQTASIEKNATINVDLQKYELAGLELMSADGHDLPPSARTFAKPEQCSMATSKDIPSDSSN